MKKVAVFGNAAGGKSMLARRVAELTRLPLFPLDAIQYRRGGGKVPHEEYLKAHADLLTQDQWIIDGFGCVPSAWERFAAADTLIYIDLPLFTHYRWVTKRLIKGLFVNPEGWPENGPIWSSTLDNYRVVGRCHRYLTPRYRQLVAYAASTKQIHHLRSPAEMRSLLEAIEQENRTRTVNDARPSVAADVRCQLRTSIKWLGFAIVATGFAVLPFAIWISGTWGIVGLALILTGGVLLAIGLAGRPIHAGGEDRLADIPPGHLGEDLRGFPGAQVFHRDSSAVDGVDHATPDT